MEEKFAFMSCFFFFLLAIVITSVGHLRVVRTLDLNNSASFENKEIQSLLIHLKSRYPTLLEQICFVSRIVGLVQLIFIKYTS